MTEIMHYRNTWAEINLAAIGYNVKQLQALLPPNSKMMGVVKANGYGHGSVQVAKTAIENGVDHLMVALLEEAILLRENGIDVPILVIGRVDPRYVPTAVEYNISLTAFQLEWFQQVNDLTLHEPINVHLELETGMGRTGIGHPEELSAIVKEVERKNNVRITGIYTHLATADEQDNAYYNEQQQCFKTLLNVFKECFDEAVMVHTGNSAAGIQYPEQMQHYTRFGIAMYGLYPSSHIKQLDCVPLKEAFSLYSELIQVKQVKRGSTISYGATYKATEEEWIGTIPIGYADGWRRALQNFHVLIEGKKMPIVGRICMDLTMIKLDRPYPIGTKVTLIGDCETASIKVDDVASYLNTINYEVPCMISNRIPRIFLESKSMNNY